MTLFGKAARLAYRAHRLERGVRDPARYAKNRVIAKGLGRLGFWQQWRRLWS